MRRREVPTCGIRQQYNETAAEAGSLSNPNRQLLNRCIQSGVACGTEQHLDRAAKRSATRQTPLRYNRDGCGDALPRPILQFGSTSCRCSTVAASFCF
jgi:hypothetical protein